MSLIASELVQVVRDRFLMSVGIGSTPESSDPAREIMPSVEGTFDRLNQLQKTLTTKAWIQEQALAIEARLQGWLEDGTWTREFPGRKVLKRYVDSTLHGAVGYEGLRNVIIDKMVDAGHQPDGMHRVLRVVASMQPEQS